MDDILFRAGACLLVFVTALLAAASAIDHGFAVQMAIVASAALLAAAAQMRGARNPYPASGARDRYDDEVIRWGVVATEFWGVIGFLVGLVIASQLAFPLLNLDSEFSTIGRLRPLHTSAVIFAFGGNALICTSFYVVQRTCRARLAFPALSRFVFWGYQLFIVLAASGYLLGINIHGRALIAWDGSASAEAALRAAVPVLRYAAAVTILYVEDGSLGIPAEEAALYL